MMILHQRGVTGTQPAAAIGIDDIPDTLQRRNMRMAADNPIDIFAPCFVPHGLFKIIDKMQSFLSLLANELGQRERFNRAVDNDGHVRMPANQIEQQIVKTVAPAGYMAADQRTVELVAMQDQHAPSIRQRMKNFIFDRDAHAPRKAQPPQDRQGADCFVMIAGQVEYFCAFMPLAHQFVQHSRDVVMPVPAFGKFPPVDNVTDKIE